MNFTTMCQVWDGIKYRLLTLNSTVVHTYVIKNETTLTPNMSVHNSNSRVGATLLNHSRN